MREQDWEKIMSSADPWARLLEIVKLYRFQYGRQTGSTLLMMRAYKDRIETLSVGDSQLAIYKNGVLVYKSTEHNTESVAEVIRLKSKSVSINKTTTPIGKVVSASKMIAYYPDYITFSDGTTIAPSQALGQNDVTGYEPEVHTELFTSEDEMRCILFSDGFSDMFLFDSDVEEDKLNDERDILTLTVAQLVEKAEKRWRGKWNWHWDEKNPDVFLETQFPEDMMDDVGVVVWDNKKAV
jgi:serine/threonine protein phosphatase PrpC